MVRQEKKKKKREFPLWLSRSPIMKMWVQYLALLSGLRIRHCPELWGRPAAAALIQPLARELPYAAGAALKRKKKKKKCKEIVTREERLPIETEVVCGQHLLRDGIIA